MEDGEWSEAWKVRKGVDVADRRRKRFATGRERKSRQGGAKGRRERERGREGREGGKETPGATRMQPSDSQEVWFRLDGRI